MTDQTRTLYLIDGHAQFFRAYYAIRSGMNSPVTGEPTHMTYGFVGMLLKLLRDHQPDYLVVAIDASGDRGTFRSQIYPDYKANRDAPPEDFRPQVDRCLEFLRALNVPVLAEEGVEADDVIATLVRELGEDHPDLQVRIVSRDKDLTQTIRAGAELFDPMKDEIVTPDAIFKTEGVEPRHVLDILTLMGDTVDNIPGVPGIGPKTAAKLVLQYGSVENLYAHLDEIKGKRRENLEASRDLLTMTRQLVSLKDDVDFSFALPEAEVDVSAWQRDVLTDLFQELGFTSHGKTLAGLAGDGEGEVPEPKLEPVAPEGGLFADDSPVAPPEPDGRYEGITTLKDLDALLKRIRQVGACAVDTETDSLSSVRSNLCGVSFAIKAGEGYYIPTRSPDPESHLTTEQVIERIRPVLEDDAILKIGQNLKFDLNVLRRHGVRLAGPMFDTMIASYVVDATRSSHSMNVLALALLNHSCIPIHDLIGKGKTQKRFDEVPLERAVPYAAEDADITLQLREALEPKISAMGLQSLFDDLEMPIVDVLAELEHNGIRVDPDELDRQRVQLQERIDELRRSILDDAPYPFNPDSPKQLAAALFNAPTAEPPGLGLSIIKRGKTGPSTDQDVLERLDANPTVQTAIPSLMLEYRQLTKLVNTYLVSLKDAINPETGRVHASFNQTVAATGRLSSSDPNLQNIPIRTDVGREIRRAFGAEDGCTLITADYSQVELRLLAHLSEDEALVEAFQQDADIHVAVAARVFGVNPDEVTSQQRGAAKMVNFGIVYGITAFGLAQRLGGEVTQGQAAGIIDEYKTRYAGIDRFLEECVAMAEAHGYVETILKRRRAIPQIHAHNANQRRLGERMAINTVVQGSAADLIKLAMIDLHRRLPGAFPDARMLLQIHDELVFEAPEAIATDVERFVVSRMEQALSLRVPLRVGSAVSQSWLEAR